MVLTKPQKEAATKDAKEQYLAIVFILNTNKNKFANYRDDCSNRFQAYYQNIYLKTLEAAYEALEKFGYDPGAYNQQSTSTSSSSRVSNSDMNDIHQTSIQDGGHRTNEETISIIHEEEE